MTRAKEMRDLPLAIDVTASGNVSIGGTANEYSNYTTLTINHDTNGGILDIERNGNLIGELYTLSATDFGIQTGQATGAMRFRTNAGEVLTLLHTGNVGIGTDNPSEKLHVLGDVLISSGTSGDAKLIIESDTDNNDENDNPEILFKQDGGWQTGGIRMANNQTVIWNSIQDAFNGGIEFKTGTVSGYANVTTKMTIEQVGNVGIGTTSPVGILTLQKDQAGSSTAGTGTTLTFNGNANAGNPWEIYRDNGTSGDLVFCQNASGTRSEAMRITLSGGNVGIGTASPSYKLHSETSSGTDYAGYFRNTSGSGNSTSLIARGGANNTSANFQVQDYGGNADFTVTGVGKVGIGTGAPLRNVSVIGSDTSSSGYKDIVEFLEPNITGGTVSVNFGVANSLNNLGKVDFTYAGAGSASNRVNLGFHSNDNKLMVYANGEVELINGQKLNAEGATIQTVHMNSYTHSSANPINVWAEVNSAYRIAITPKYVDSVILATYHIPINPTGASNILMAIAPWSSTNNGATQTLLSQGASPGIRHNLAVSWFRSNNGYDGNDMQNHVVHFRHDHNTTNTLTYGFQFRSEGSNNTYFCHSGSNNSTWGWVAPIYMELREIR